MDWFLYDNGHRHERVNNKNAMSIYTLMLLLLTLLKAYLWPIQIAMMKFFSSEAAAKKP